MKALIILLAIAMSGCATYNDIETLKARVDKIEKYLSPNPLEGHETIEGRIGNLEAIVCRSDVHCSEGNRIDEIERKSHEHLVPDSL